MDGRSRFASSVWKVTKWRDNDSLLNGIWAVRVLEYDNNKELIWKMIYQRRLCLPCPVTAHPLFKRYYRKKSVATDLIECPSSFFLPASFCFPSQSSWRTSSIDMAQRSFCHLVTLQARYRQVLLRWKSFWRVNRNRNSAKMEKQLLSVCYGGSIDFLATHLPNWVIN